MKALLGAFALVVSLLGCASAQEDRALKNDPPRVENDRRTCTDRVDNDDDGLVDCADPSCVELCGLPDNETDCADSIDNDRDGHADCADDECGEADGCGAEDRDERCADQRDNDLDGLFDCFDPDCRDSPTVDFCGAERSDDACRDLIDNDTDGSTDCEDPDCERSAPCSQGEPEDDVRTCSDGLDNDFDGRRDCADSQCQASGAAGCSRSETGEQCADGIDNDGDGTRDCEDSGCVLDPYCEGARPEDDLSSCTDGVDNDRDGRADCADLDCVGAITECGPEENERCIDRIDNDGDGATDCTDPDCASAPACSPLDSEDDAAECDDRVDNDADGAIDCADSGCAAVGACGPEETRRACGDQIDNDGDGAVDCADTDCSGSAACADPESGDTECQDDADNDLDGFIDCADPSCFSASPCDGAEELRCDDAVDNDGDGAADCADADCTGTPECSTVAETLCANEEDDDGDGAVDCADLDCLLDFTQSVCDSPALNLPELQDPRTTLLPGTRGDSIDDPARVRQVVVTAVDPQNPRVVWLSEPDTSIAYGAIRAYLRGPAASSELLVGDLLDVAGLLTEARGTTTLDVYALNRVDSQLPPPPRRVSLSSLGSVLPAAEAGNDRYDENATTGEVLDPVDDFLTAERYESVLIELVDLRVGVIETGRVRLADGAFEIVVGTRFHSPTGLRVGQAVDAVAGVLTYIREPLGAGFARNYVLEPRDASDWQFEVVADEDDDGLSNAEEALLGTDPNDPDTDRDFFTDLEEAGLDPSAPLDFDGDGQPDALESFLIDVDGDGVSDEFDAAELVSPLDDRDGDGLLNATDPDDDGDGICDSVFDTLGCSLVAGMADLCPFAPTSSSSEAFPGSATANRDLNEPLGDLYLLGSVLYPGAAVGDACDFDPDGDLILGVNDNCPNDNNPSQLDTDGDGVGNLCDSNEGLVPLPCVDPSRGGREGCELIIEEVLYNLSTATSAGVLDANRDGVPSISQDELVEIRNVSRYALDLSGYRFDDDASFVGSPRHVFPPGTLLQPGQRLLLFGGGAPRFFSSATVVQTASSGALGLNNGSDVISISDPLGLEIVVSMSFGGPGTDVTFTTGRNVSISRYPEGTERWAPHPDRRDPVIGDVRAASPGAPPDNGLLPATPARLEP